MLLVETCCPTTNVANFFESIVFRAPGFGVIPKGFMVRQIDC